MGVVIEENNHTTSNWSYCS